MVGLLRKKYEITFLMLMPMAMEKSRLSKPAIILLNRRTRPNGKKMVA
jgi:hypothetical protein